MSPQKVAEELFRHCFPDDRAWEILCEMLVGWEHGSDPEWQAVAARINQLVVE